MGHDEQVGQREDIRLSFNEAVEIYDPARPSYPGEMFEPLPAAGIDVGPRLARSRDD